VPSYNFLRKSTGETWTDRMSIAEMEAKLAEDKDLDVVPVAVPIGDGYRLGTWKPDNHSLWREHLRKIHKNAGKQSNINTL
jgi:hypothetical protein